MKNLFIGLLIVTAGAGIFFYLQNKKKHSQNSIQKELLIGQWKIDSIKTAKDSNKSFLVGIMGMIDSNLLKYKYEFTKDGSILRSMGDSTTKDSSYFEWNKKSQLVWKENLQDSTGTDFQIAKLNTDSLQLQSDDSTVLFLTRLK